MSGAEQGRARAREIVHADDYDPECERIATLMRPCAVCQRVAAALAQVRAEAGALRAEVEQLRAAKDGAYAERNRCVAMLAAIFPSSLERHPESDTTWEDDWRWIVFVDLPTGQASWHIHDSEVALFDHVPRLRGRVWDGHTNEEKYARLLSAALRQRAGARAEGPSAERSDGTE